MIRAFLLNVAEAYRAPRLSARRMLALKPTALDCALMVVLAFALQSLAGMAIEIVSPAAHGAIGAGGGGLRARATELILQLVLFGVLTAGTFSIGRRFGGVASAEECAAVVGWHYVATAFLAPLNIIGLRAVNPETNETGAAFMLMPFAVALSIWIFASFVAEAHGFRQLGGVIVATVGGFLALAIVTMALVTAVGAAPGPG